jgi:hypothetical protein
MIEKNGIYLYFVVYITTMELMIPLNLFYFHLKFKKKGLIN